MAESVESVGLTGQGLEGLDVAVYGLGKMGLPLAAVLADRGAAVAGVDLDDAVVDAVNDGRTPVENEPGLPELVERHGGERLAATTDGAAAAARSDVMIVLVPTLVDEEGRADLGPVMAAADDIAEGLDTGDLVILESTVPPGTTAGPFLERLEASGLDAGDGFGVAHCPERTYSGRVIRDLTESYPKIVGGVDEGSTEAAATIYERFNEPGVLTMSSATAAEAVKVFEGVYRDTNIALANELAKACEQWGLDSEEVFDAANSQPFCDIHDPGVGVGGHCIPVYPQFVAHDVDETPVIDASRRVNEGMPAHTVDVLEALLGTHERSLDESRVRVLGLTYRGGVKETRHAPGIDVADELADRGADVSVHDPLVGARDLPGLEATFVDDADDVEGIDGVVLATAHEEYGDLDLDAMADLMRTPVLVDGRRFFDDADASGFTYARIGRSNDDGQV